MIAMIISLVLILITGLFLGYKEETIKKETRYTEAETQVVFKMRKRMLLSLLWLIIVVPFCFKSVKTGEIGIKTRFGKITTTYLSEGINFKLPFEKIEKINIKVQKYENKDGLETSTKDMQIVTGVVVAINYQIDEKQAVSLYRRVGNGYKETILEPAIQEVIKASISKYTAEELVVSRSEVSTNIQELLSKRLEDYGINVYSVSLKNFDFSQAYNNAIEQKAVAEKNVEISKNKQEQVKIDAETAKIKAQGEAEANKVLEKTLTKELIQQQFIEKWDGKLPTVTNGNNVMDISSFIK